MKSISFAGDPSFASAELLAAAGLAAGTSLDQAGMQAAAQRLLDSGMFSNVKFGFDGRELRYELTPATNLLPARFANFPWWDEKDLSAQLAAKVPLFHGQAAPESGTERKLIEALTAMVSEQIAAGQMPAAQKAEAQTKENADHGNADQGNAD